MAEWAQELGHGACCIHPCHGSDLRVAAKSILGHTRWLGRKRGGGYDWLPPSAVRKTAERRRRNEHDGQTAVAGGAPAWARQRGHDPPGPPYRDARR